MEMNKFDRLESWIDDLQHERRPRATETDHEDGEQLRSVRLLKILGSQPRLHPVFDAQMKGRIAGRMSAKRIAAFGRGRSKEQAQSGWFSFLGLRPQMMASAFAVILLLVVGVAVLFQQPVGDSLSLAFKRQNGTITNRIQNVNTGGLTNDAVAVLPPADSAPESPAEKNPEQQPSPSEEKKPENKSANTNEDGEPDEPEQPVTPSTPPPSDSLALDLSGLQQRQAAMSVSLASVNTEFDDLNGFSDPVLAAMSQDFNELSF